MRAVSAWTPWRFAGASCPVIQARPRGSWLPISVLVVRHNPEDACPSWPGTRAPALRRHPTDRTFGKTTRAGAAVLIGAIRRRRRRESSLKFASVCIVMMMMPRPSTIEWKPVRSQNRKSRFGARVVVARVLFATQIGDPQQSAWIYTVTRRRIKADHWQALDLKRKRAGDAGLNWTPKKAVRTQPRET